MKTHNLLTIFLFFLALTAAGCDGIAFMHDGRSKRTDDVITVTPVDDPQLAKLILKPSPKSVQIPRDPFKPIYSTSTNRSEIKRAEPIRAQFSDLYFIGMIKMDSQAIALLKLGEKKLMLKLNEQYKGFVIKEISNTQVIFSDGQTQITLKRGVKK
jgi:hypothetical protein